MEIKFHPAPENLGSVCNVRPVLSGTRPLNQRGVEAA